MAWSKPLFSWLKLLSVKLPSGQNSTSSLPPQLRDVQNHHPVGYASLISPSLQLIHSTIFVPGNEGQLNFMDCTVLLVLAPLPCCAVYAFIYLLG